MFTYWGWWLDWVRLSVCTELGNKILIRPMPKQMTIEIEHRLETACCIFKVGRFFDKVVKITHFWSKSREQNTMLHNLTIKTWHVRKHNKLSTSTNNPLTLHYRRRVLMGGKFSAFKSQIFTSDLNKLLGNVSVCDRELSAGNVKTLTWYIGFSINLICCYHLWSKPISAK